MDRLDVYTAVHKMQRRRLFELTVEAGTLDPDDAPAATRLAGAVTALCAELSAHAEHEDRFIHPLLRTHAPALAAALEVEHVELDARLEQLREAARRDPDGLHRALSRFTATYLAHLAREEDEALPALWGSCSDEELRGILTSFRASRSDVAHLTGVLAQLPTLNQREILRMAATLGPDVTTELADVLATVLRPAQLGALRLGVTSSLRTAAV
jgi:iron-sulfur cluster repair protein YtfE (RIC family)